MAVQVLFHNSVTAYDAQDARQATGVFSGSSLTGLRPRSGVKLTNGADFEVTVAGLTATVKTGIAYIDGANVLQGGYPIYNDANADLVIAGSHATLSRYDLVYLAVQDSDLGQGAGKTAVLGIATGTPNASPVEPTGLLPVNSIQLARLTVPPSSGTITVLDRRKWLAALGGVVRYESGIPVDLPDGVPFYLTGTGKMMYLHQGTAIALYDPTVAWNNIGIGAGFETANGQTPQMLTDGHWRHLRGRLQRTGGATIPGNTTFLMTTLGVSDRPPVGRVLWFPVAVTPGATWIVARVEINGNDGGIRIYIPTNQSTVVVDVSSIRWSTL